MNREFALELLRALRARPQMTAHTREAFAAQVVLLLELLDVSATGGCSISPEAIRDLHMKTFRVPGTCAADRDKLIAEVDDDWARAFIDDAMKLASRQLNREYYMYEKPK